MDCQASHWEDHKDYCQVLVRRRELGVALYVASRDGEEQKVPLLVSLGAEVGYKLEEQPNLGYFPLLTASFQGQEKVVRALLKAGAKPNQRGGQYSCSALFAAAQNNFPRIACILLAGGADINLANYQGGTPLYIACYNNKLDVVKLLVRARGINVNQCHEGGWSPLLIASHEGHAEVVSVLLEAVNIDVNLATSDGSTPLYIACQANSLDVVKLLVRARGINVNQCMEDGFSPLHIASQEGHAEVVSVLLTAGSDVHLKTDEGDTALVAAIYFKHTAVMALLLAHIAKQEGAEAADKAEVGAVLSVLVSEVEVEE